MKAGVFVDGLSNIQRFYESVKTVEGRGAPEASWDLVEGDAGFGKSKALSIYAFKRNLPFVRAKSDWTPSWMLRDLAFALGLNPVVQRTQALFDLVAQEIMVRQGDKSFALVVDEINHASRSLRVLETLRDLTDLAEAMLIAGGTRDAYAAMKRYPQIRSRICDVVTFGPATAEDVVTICSELTDVRIHKDLAEQIQKKTGGRLREIMNAIARVEAFAKKMRTEKVSLEDFGNRPLINEDRARQLAAVANG